MISLDDYPEAGMEVMDQPVKARGPYWAVIGLADIDVTLNHGLLGLEQLGMALSSLRTHGEMIYRLFKWSDVPNVKTEMIPQMDRSRTM